MTKSTLSFGLYRRSVICVRVNFWITTRQGAAKSFVAGKVFEMVLDWHVNRKPVNRAAKFQIVGFQNTHFDFISSN